MKEIVFLIVLGCLSGCERHSKSNRSHAADTPVNNALREDTAARTAPAANNEFQRWYADKELEDYLDSIGKLSPSRWMKKVAFIPDSTFKSRQALDETIPANDFAILKKACKTGHLDLTSAKRIFRHAELDSGDMEMDSLPVTFLSFDQDKDDFTHFAISPGHTDITWSCELYFFKKNTIIARHVINHRYGLDLRHYIDGDGRVVIYYKENFGSGSGIWWFNFFFYKYDGDQLIPILNELENANLQSPWGIRVLWLESTVQQTNPLVLKMVYYQEFAGTTNPRPVIVKDSTFVRYRWDGRSKTLVGNYEGSKISKPQILSYYLAENELLFIHAYYKMLKNCLSDSTKRSATLIYLNDVKRHYDNNHSSY